MNPTTEQPPADQRCCGNCKSFLDIRLEPLPKPLLLRRVMPDDYRYGDVYGYTGEQMLAYATRCIAAERAALITSFSGLLSNREE